MILFLITSIGRTEENADYAKGKQIYEKSCTECHDLVNPADFYPEEWEILVRTHGPEANLTPREQKLIIIYLKAESSI